MRKLGLWFSPKDHMANGLLVFRKLRLSRFSYVLDKFNNNWSVRFVEIIFSDKKYVGTAVLLRNSYVQAAEFTAARVDLSI